VKGLFDLDGPFAKTASKLGDFILLSLCFVITSLFLVTIGTSLQAAEAVGMNLAEGKDGYVIRRYFKYWKENFKTSTAIYLTEVAVLTVIGISMWLWNENAGKFGFFSVIGIALCVAVISFVLLLHTFLYAVVGRYQTGYKKTIELSLFLAIKNLPLALVILAIPVLVIVGCYYSLAIGMIAFFVGFGGCFYLNGVLRLLAFEREPELKTDKEVVEENGEVVS